MPHARKPKSTPKTKSKGGRHASAKSESKVVAAAVSAAVHATEKNRSRPASRKAKHSRKGPMGGMNPEVALWSQMMLQPDVCLTDTNVKRLARLPDGNSSAVLSCSGTLPALTVPPGYVAIVYGVPVGEALRYSWLDLSSHDAGAGYPVVGVVKSLAPCAGFVLLAPRSWVDVAGIPPLHSPFLIDPGIGLNSSAPLAGSSTSPWFSLPNDPSRVCAWDTNYKIYNAVFGSQTQNTADARVGHRYMPLAEWVFSALTLLDNACPNPNDVLANMNSGVVRLQPLSLSEGAAAFTMCCNVDATGAPKEPDAANGAPGLSSPAEQRSCPARFNVMDMYWQGNPNYLTQCTVHGFSTQVGPGGLFGFETAFCYDGRTFSAGSDWETYLKFVSSWFTQTCCVMNNEARQFTDKYQVMNLGLSGESGFHLCTDGAEDVTAFQPLGNPNNAFVTSAMFPSPSTLPNGNLEDKLRKELRSLEAVDVVDVVDMLTRVLAGPANIVTPWTPGARDADLTREYLPQGQRLTFGLLYNNSTQPETFVATHVAAFQFQCNRGMGLEERPTTDQRIAIRAALRAIRTHPVLVGPHSFGDWFKTLKDGVLGVGREIATVGSDIGRSMWLGAKMVGKHAAASSMFRMGGRMIGSMAADEAALGALMLV